MTRTREQKLSVIGWCKLPCASALRRVREQGGAVADAALDVCVDNCLR